MSRLKTIERKDTKGRVREVLDGVQAKFGMTPNLMGTMANSPQVLEAYLGITAALKKGVLPAKLREGIALLVAEINGCEYCLAAHSATGKMAGMSGKDLLDSRRGASPDSKVEAALKFTRILVERRGNVRDSELGRVRAAGYGDTEIAEIVANVSANIFSNYFDHLAQPEIDFPRVGALEHVSSNG